ncbi:MAG: hypothetical protein QM820_36220 [Minicystis sp.]
MSAPWGSRIEAAPCVTATSSACTVPEVVVPVQVGTAGSSTSTAMGALTSTALPSGRLGSGWTLTFTVIVALPAFAPGTTVMGTSSWWSETCVAAGARTMSF